MSMRNLRRQAPNDPAVAVLNIPPLVRFASRNRRVSSRSTGSGRAGLCSTNAVRPRQFRVGPAVMTDRERQINTACPSGLPESVNIDDDNEKQIVYQQNDLFSQGYPVFEEIRRQGKLCDVTLKVRPSLTSVSRS